MENFKAIYIFKGNTEASRFHPFEASSLPGWPLKLVSTG
jgi:hypothetical protein